nr:unnamed protein product [Callosobruchus chinensis]
MIVKPPKRYIRLKQDPTEEARRDIIISKTVPPNNPGGVLSSPYHVANKEDASAEWVDMFHNKLAPCCVSSPIIQPEHVMEDHESLNLITIQELEIALKQNNKTASGKDQMYYLMLHQLPQANKLILLNIRVYNDIYSRIPQIPKAWYDYAVVPEKNRKPSRFIHTDLWPASCVLKTMNK